MVIVSALTKSAYQSLQNLLQIYGDRSRFAQKYMVIVSALTKYMVIVSGLPPEIYGDRFRIDMAKPLIPKAWKEFPTNTSLFLIFNLFL